MLKMISSSDLVELKPGLKFSRAALNQILPTPEMALFFGKVYKLDGYQLGNLLSVLFHTTLAQALVNGSAEHSMELQDYVVELGYDHLIELGEVTFAPDVPHGEILPELWKSLEVQVAQSIADVAEKLKDVVGHMPGKEGEMLFKTMATMNAKRPTLGDHKAYIHHAPAADNLVILDVSGSMSEATVQTIIDDVVAMSYMANAHLAIVSNGATTWGPGDYDSASVLKVAEFGGTHYETLAPLLDQDWGIVVTIADYDSSASAASAIAKCTGRIQQVLDISLVSRPSYLSEVVGQLAEEVKPLLVAKDDHSLLYGY
jgi:hypothetical protein